MRHSLIMLALLSALTAISQEVYTVETKVKKAAISPTLWGLFFEDINRGADGGLYAEMVKNRSFDFPKPMTAWTEWPKKARDGIFLVTDHLKENPNDPKILTVTTMTAD